MSREMRRKRQLLSDAETIEMLQACTSGVLAVHGDDGYPYAVPLSYAYEDGSIYFHSATAGHKIDAIERDAKVSFCVIADDDVIQSTFTTHYRSVVAFGRASIVADDTRKRHALRLLAEKYSPDYLDAADGEIEGAWDRLVVIELEIEEMSGKAGIEIIKERAQA